MHTLTATDGARSFWDRIAPKYARRPIADPEAYAAKLERLRDLLRAGDHVLEIGCGTGSTALRLAPAVAHVTATDVSAGMIGIARAKLGPGAPANVDFQQADALEPVAGAPFDAVCAFSLLHLVHDVPRVLDTVRARLRPGGLFISKTVCLRDRKPWIGLLVRLLTAIGVAPRVTLLGRDGLVEDLEAAGFEIEEITYFDAARMNPFIVARRPSA